MIIKREGEKGFMEKKLESFYILHMSDFHISEQESVICETEKGLEEVVNVIKEKEKINISYLIHTGDIIDSSDLKEEFIKQKYTEEYRKVPTDIEYDNYLESIAKKRFEIAETIFKNFVDRLEVLKANIVVCCGNHDRVHYKGEKKDDFALFENFLRNLKQESFEEKIMGVYQGNDLNVLVLNTNNENKANKKERVDKKEKKSVVCIKCEEVIRELESSEKNRIESTNWCYSSKNKENILVDTQKLNIIVAHKPLYDICEQARLPYEAQTQTTDFLSKLQDFTNGSGIYLCGDKHTSSIAASYIHDIPHYFCGHPFVFEKNELPKGCFLKNDSNEMKNGNIKKQGIDYNLIEVRNARVGQIRKLHLLKKESGWECEVRPIDTVVAKLYEKSKKYIVKNSFEYLTVEKRDLVSSSSWSRVFEYMDSIIKNNSGIIKEVSDFYRLFCRLKEQKEDDSKQQKSQTIFEEVNEIIEEFLKQGNVLGTENILNIRGDYGSGKSTFLGLLYIYLLYCYSCGKIKYIPAYFNLENEEILDKIQKKSTYSSAVKQTFNDFVRNIEEIAKIEHMPVCYIVDGLDEQDIWSESSQDSVGQVILDILSETNNFKYIMAFSQNKLGRFKNTMPVIKYYEKSRVMYFKPIEVEEKYRDKSEENKFSKFVHYVLKTENKDKISEPKECEAIRKLRRLSIDVGFMYYNYEYLKDYKAEDSIEDMYKRYIDQQHKICESFLEYKFEYYAPAVAYLFAYEGYTYERFKNIASDTPVYLEKQILENSDNLYKTFIFVKKQKDAREYLLALHYNRELCYFAENMSNEIPGNSILNKLIPRNISLIIKKLWETDQNKFIIVCQKLIQRARKKQLNKCTLSMLIYVLSYLKNIPSYNRDEITSELKELDDLKNMYKISKEVWKIAGNNSEKIQKFMDLNLLHSEKIMDAVNLNNSSFLVRELLNSSEFRLYNRQYMMWYYGDLTIYGENGVNNLVPGEDVVHKGIDYYNCFYVLYHKVYGYFDSKCGYSYPLLDFDLFTVLDLLYSRSLHRSESGAVEERKKQIYTYTEDIFSKYMQNKKQSFERQIESKEKDKIEGLLSRFENNGLEENKQTNKINQIREFLNREQIENDEIYVYLFAKILKEEFNSKKDIETRMRIYRNRGNNRNRKNKN